MDFPNLAAAITKAALSLFRNRNYLGALRKTSANNSLRLRWVQMTMYQSVRLKLAEM